jgi:hypothetical protein
MPKKGWIAMKWQHDIGCSSSKEKGSATVESTQK